MNCFVHLFESVLRSSSSFFCSLSVFCYLLLSVHLFRQLQIKQRTLSALQHVKACSPLMSLSTRHQQCCDVTSENAAFSQSWWSGALASQVLSAPWTGTPPQQLNQHLPLLWLPTPISQHSSPTLRGHCVLEALFILCVSHRVCRVKLSHESVMLLYFVIASTHVQFTHVSIHCTDVRSVVC